MIGIDKLYFSLSFSKQVSPQLISMKNDGTCKHEVEVMQRWQDADVASLLTVGAKLFPQSS